MRYFREKVSPSQTSNSQGRIVFALLLFCNSKTILVWEQLLKKKRSKSFQNIVKEFSIQNSAYIFTIFWQFFDKINAKRNLFWEFPNKGVKYASSNFKLRSSSVNITFEKLLKNPCTFEKPLHFSWDILCTLRTKT